MSLFLWMQVSLQQDFVGVLIQFYLFAYRGNVGLKDMSLFLWMQVSLQQDFVGVLIQFYLFAYRGNDTFQH